MRLWNIVPHIEEERCKHSVADDVIEAIVSFFDRFYVDNHPVKFKVDKIIFISPGLNNRLSKIGKIIEREDLPEIVSLAIHDEMRIIARGEGCRFFSFGYDLDSWICTKHEDIVQKDIPGLIISDISGDLINTDWYDG